MNIIENPSAFPWANDADKQYNWINRGMTLRDYFAAQAMQGLLAANWCADLRNDHYGEDAGNRSVAIDAYMMADAMLKARGA